MGLIFYVSFYRGQDAASCGSAGPANSFAEHINSRKESDNQSEPRKAISPRESVESCNAKTRKTRSPSRVPTEGQIPDKERLVRKRSVEKKKESTRTRETADGKVKVKKSRASRESDKKGKASSQARARDANTAVDQSESHASLEEEPNAKPVRIPFPAESNLRVIKESLSQSMPTPAAPVELAKSSATSIESASQGDDSGAKVAPIGLNDEPADSAVSSRAKTAHKKKSSKKKKHVQKKRLEQISPDEEASFESAPDSNPTGRVEEQVESAEQPEQKEEPQQQQQQQQPPLVTTQTEQPPKRATVVVQQR